MGALCPSFGARGTGAYRSTVQDGCAHPYEGAVLHGGCMYDGSMPCSTVLTPFSTDPLAAACVAATRCATLSFLLMVPSVLLWL